MKRMLINATQEEELRMAMVDGQRLYDLNIEGPSSERKKANIYKGKITRIEPSLEAAFVDYGAERHGFLPLKEISAEYFVKDPKNGGKPSIKDVLKEGQDIVVQIDKEERGNKGAALTTFVSLAGRFIVLKPNKANSGGVSRRIVGGDRDAARESMKGVEIPEGMSVILRTAGIDRSAEELDWDLQNLLAVWQAILNVVLERPSPFLIYRESNAVVRALRDYLTNDIGEILIDDEATYEEAKEFVQQVMPHNLKKLKYYTDPVTLFTRYQIESQIESAFAHDVNLPSGGSIVIDHTEALVSIDINSARATKGGDIEATALNTNLEAAEEIARQLRLRDLGGLIVIDFIDMGPQKNQRAVENKLREAVRQDRARVQIGKISRFGLLEMSRQRLRPSLGESSYHTCPRCSGIGTIRSVESMALAILRIMGEEARKERTSKVIAQLPIEVATYLLNEKRDWVQSLETEHGTHIVLIANAALETPHYDIRRVRDDQTDLPENTGASYELVDESAEPEVPVSMEERKPQEKAAVGKIVPKGPAPSRKETEQTLKKDPGFWSRLFSIFADGDKEGEEAVKAAKKKPAKKKASKRKTKKRGEQDASSNRNDGGTRKKRTRRKKTRGGEKREAANKQQNNQQGADGKQAKGDDAQDKPKPKRNRRSRGGRRRRQEGDKQQDAQANGQDNSQQAGKDNSGPPKARTDAERAADKKRAEAQADQQAGENGGQPEPARKKQPSRKRSPKKDAANGKDAAPSESQAGNGAAAEPKPKKQDKPQAAAPAEATKTDASPSPEQKTVPANNGADGAKPAQPSKQADAPKSESGEPKPAPKPQHADAAPKSDSNAAKRDEANADAPKPKKAEDKPEGRLLPWEPAQSDAKKSGDAPANSD